MPHRPRRRWLRRLNYWCFAPLVDSVRGKVNAAELARVVVIGLLNALAAGVATHVGVSIMVLEAIRDNAATIFAPAIAAAVAAACSATTAFMHRKYHGKR
jgi:hypothetical protein